jgi:hypothetical protein
MGWEFSTQLESVTLASMKPHRHLEDSKASESDKPVFRVLMAYEDVATGGWAEKAYSQLMDHLAADFSVRHSRWRFDQFQSPAERARAVGEAAEANIIILATRQQDTLPAEARQWIEEWLDEKVLLPQALVALFSRANPPLRHFIEEVARRGRLDLFSWSLPLLIQDLAETPAVATLSVPPLRIETSSNSPQPLPA